MIENDNARAAQVPFEASSDVRASRLRTLAHLNQMVSSSLDLTVVLGGIARAAATLMGAPVVEFWVANEATRMLELRAFSDPRLGADKEVKTLAFGEGGAGWVALHRRLLDVPDVFADDRLFRLEWWREHDLRSALWVPILLDDTLLGVLSVCGRKPFHLGPDDHDLLESFVAQAAVAIRHARLFAESEARRSAAEALASVGRVLSQTIEPGEVAQRIADSVCRLLDGQCSALFRLEEDSGDLVRLAVSGGAAPLGEHVVFPRDTGVVALAVRDREAVVTPDLLTDSRVTLPPEIRERIERAGYRSVLAVPLLARDRVVGALALGDRAGRHFDRQQVQLAQAFAAQAGLALQNAELYQRAQTRLGRMRRLTELSQLVTSSLDLPKVLEFATNTILELLNVDLARLWVVDEPAGLIRMAAQASRGPEPDPGTAVTERPLGMGAIGWVVEHRAKRYSEDVGADPIQFNGAWFRAWGYVSQVAVPLVVGERALGALSVLTKTRRTFSEEDEELVELFAANVATALENAHLYRRAEQRAERLAALSTLTGLITQAADSRKVYDEIARAATMLLGGRMARVWVDDPTAGLFRIQGTFSVDPAFQEPAIEFAAMAHGRGLLGAAVAARAAEYITDIQQDPRFQNQALARDGDFHAAAVVPLVNGERVAGVLFVFFGRRAHFAEEEKALMQVLANKAAIVLEKSRLYEEAQAALARVEAKNAELDSFVYMVSHDLKAPLVTIQGMASMLALDCAPALDERGRHYLTRIESNIEQMEQLISDLLALSRIGREARPAEQVSLNELVDEVLTTLAGTIRARGVTIVRGDLGSVWAIRTQLQQVFSNLIGNAVKYLGDEPKPHVEIGACRRGAWVECHVKDNGIGIDQAYHTKVFELFQRLKEVPVEGSGVGLPIVKKIVEATGGRIWVESTRGQGATFRFTWPVSPERRSAGG